MSIVNTPSIGCVPMICFGWVEVIWSLPFYGLKQSGHTFLVSCPLTGNTSQNKLAYDEINLYLIFKRTVCNSEPSNASRNVGNLYPLFSAFISFTMGGTLINKGIAGEGKGDFGFTLLSPDFTKKTYRDLYQSLLRYLKKSRGTLFQSTVSLH